jgi:hypothetical protein
MLMIHGNERKTGAQPLHQSLRGELRRRLRDSSLEKLSAELELSTETLLRAAGGYGVRSGTRALLERALAAPRPSEARAEGQASK